MKYAFIKAHRDEFSLRAMCRVLKVHVNGLYAWLKNGSWDQAKRRCRLTGLIKQSRLESGCVYGYRKIHHDLLSLGETCASNTVAKLMRDAGLRVQVGPGKYGTKPDVVAANQLQQDFNVDAPATKSSSIRIKVHSSDHNLEASMSRRGNCYDNAVAESFFYLLKTERIRRKLTKPVKKHGRTCSIT